MITEQWNDIDRSPLEAKTAADIDVKAFVVETPDSERLGIDATDESEAPARRISDQGDRAMAADELEVAVEVNVQIKAIDEEIWEVDASCRSASGAAELFFSEELADIVAAKRICADCPVIAPCLEGAISRAEPCGVWGGQLFSNGRVLAQKRRRGRPPKVPRPEDQLPVIPVPEHLQRLIA